MSEIPDLLERFRRGGELLAVVTTGAAGAELDWAPEPGKWTIRQIVCHLADTEIVVADRLRRTIAEENPTLIWFDEKAWTDRLDYGRRKFSRAIETFRHIRQDNYDLIKELDGAAWQRKAMHSTQGAITLLDLLRTYAEHAENHSKQIQGLRQQYKQSKNQ